MNARHRPSPRAAALALLVAGAGVALAGCDTDHVAGVAEPMIYNQRHPIVLSEASTRLDLPVGAGRTGLTDRQKEDIRDFAQDWRRNGRGPVGLMVPAGGVSGSAAAFATPAIRNTLAAAGVPSTAILTRRYDAGGAEGVAPVKLGFVKLKASVTHPCGFWPGDLAYGGDIKAEAPNGDYWNYGCATQANLAAQVADPEDLARPRAQSPAYAARREQVTEKYRAGEDSATSYSQQQSKISSAGGGN